MRPNFDIYFYRTPVSGIWIKLSSIDVKQKNRDNVIWFVVVIMMVINFGVLTYTTLNSDNNGGETQALETELNNLRFQINNAQQEIESLKEEIRISELPNNTPNLGFIELFNKTQNSVVLIETDSGTGSGWIYDNQGHIITNNHVVEDAATIQVTFQIGTVLPAKLIGRDPYSDMAVIKVKPVEGLLHPMDVGLSSELLVGEMVIADYRHC
jgi:S1-C subfamily serine protease